MEHAKDILQYIRQNRDSWYAFATSDKYGIQCEPSDIIMVRSTMKTSAWAVAAYEDSGNRNHNLSFDCVGGSLGNAGFQLASHVAVNSSVEYRMGPVQASTTSSINMDFTPSTTAGTTGSGVLPEHEFALSKAIVPDAKKNQTVFLGYYKVKRRIFIFRKISAAARLGDVELGSDPPPPSDLMIVEDDSPSVEKNTLSAKVCERRKTL